jgi:hypothetical protein
MNPRPASRVNPHGLNRKYELVFCATFKNIYCCNVIEHIVLTSGN